MRQITTLDLVLLRFTYSFIAIGLALFVWPDFLLSNIHETDSQSVVQAFLGAMSLCAILGIAHPVKMLPALMLEFIWKVLWLVFYGLPGLARGNIDEFGKETMLGCAMGVALLLIALPWRYMLSNFFQSKPEAWRANLYAGSNNKNRQKITSFL